MDLEEPCIDFVNHLFTLGLMAQLGSTKDFSGLSLLEMLDLAKRLHQICFQACENNFTRIERLEGSLPSNGNLDREAIGITAFADSDDALAAWQELTQLRKAALEKTPPGDDQGVKQYISTLGKEATYHYQQAKTLARFISDTAVTIVTVNNDNAVAPGLSLPETLSIAKRLHDVCFQIREKNFERQARLEKSIPSANTPDPRAIAKKATADQMEALEAFQKLTALSEKAKAETPAKWMKDHFAKLRRDGASCFSQAKTAAEDISKTAGIPPPAGASAFPDSLD